MNELRRYVLAALPAVVLLAAGCSRYGRNEDFIPATSNARKALEAALKSWQEGRPPGEVAGASAPKVEAVDSRWKAGHKIKAFEILKEDESGQGPPSFTVRLTPAKGSPQEVRYIVLGADPVWVYREDDFKRVGGGAGM